MAPTLVNVKRNSYTYATPVVDARGLTVLAVASQVVADWGRLKVTFDGIDVTMYRDIATQVRSWTVNEPFGDGAAVVAFPQITAFESLPAWLADFTDVGIRLVRPDASERILWEGMWTGEDGSLDETSDVLTLTCIGSLYQLDLFKHPPAFVPTLVDIGQEISDLIDFRVDTYGLRVSHLTWAPTGIYTPRAGSWQPVLTGRIQDILATAQLQTDLTDGEVAVALESLPDDSGYWVFGSLGIVVPFNECTPYFGSRRGLQLNEPIVAAAVTPAGDGYWMAAADGGVFAFGGAGFYGSSLTPTAPITDIEPTNSGLGYWLAGSDGNIYAHGDAINMGSGVGTVVTPIVDMAGYSTDGYWMVSRAGHVYSFGVVGYHGGDSGSGKTFVAIEPTPSGLGYWLLASDGTVYAHGDAVWSGDMSGVTLSQPMVDMNRAPGGGYRLAAADGGIFDFGGAAFWGSIPAGNGTANQWTLACDHPRTPVLRLKDRCTVNWTVTTGSPGLKVNLSRDLTLASNVIFGEGTSPGPESCRWRNSRYPIGGDAFFLPLAADRTVDPNLYDQFGNVIGPSPDFDPSKVRVEHYENMGNLLSKADGVLSAKGELLRDKHPGYVGTLVLQIDPQEGSRFEMRAGQNVLLRSYRGRDVRLHIGQVSVDWDAQTVTLQVDEKARDLITLNAVKSRDRDPVDPTRKKRPTYRNSKAIEDRVAVFDCEQGAGQWAMGAFAAGWHVVQVPLAQRGTIVRSVVTADAAIGFAVAVFATAQTAASVAAVIPDPFGSGTLTDDPWDDWPEAALLIEAWGGPGQPAGFSPGSFSAGDPATGVMDEKASWYYDLPTPPWVWVAVYHAEAGAHAFTGRFYSGADTT